MYACEMQICCYNSVKYFARIQFHVYQRSLTFQPPYISCNLYSKKIKIEVAYVQLMMHNLSL